MVDSNIEQMSLEQLIKALATTRTSPDSHLPAAMMAAIQSRLVADLNGAICQATDGIVRQGSSLERLVERARDDFVTESRALRESMGTIRSSLRKFRKSNEKSSKALTVATYVLAGVAGIQALIFFLQWLK